MVYIRRVLSVDSGDLRVHWLIAGDGWRSSAVIVHPPMHLSYIRALHGVPLE